MYRIPRSLCTFAEKRNGTGGRMATETKAEGANRAEAGKRKPAASKKERKPRTKNPEEADNSGAITDEDRSLSEEAHTVMGRLSHVIVEHLLVRANQGDMKSAQMLVELAKEEAEAKEVLERGPHRSQALAWAAEPPWQDEDDGEKAETWSGSREAEQE